MSNVPSPTPSDDPSDTPGDPQSEALHYRVVRAIVSRLDAGESAASVARDYDVPLYVVEYLGRTLRTRLWARHYAKRALRRERERVHRSRIGGRGCVGP